MQTERDTHTETQTHAERHTHTEREAHTQTLRPRHTHNEIFNIFFFCKFYTMQMILIFVVWYILVLDFLKKIYQ